MIAVENCSHWMPDEIVERIGRALDRTATTIGTAPDEMPVPGLDGYGETGRCARRILADLGAFHAGRIAWRDVEGRTVIDDRDDLGAMVVVHRVAQLAGLPLHRVGPLSFTAAGTCNGMTEGLDAALRPILDGPPAFVAVELPEAGSNLESPFAHALDHVLSRHEGTLEGFPVVTIMAYPDRIRPSLLHPGRLGRSTRMAYPTAGDLAWMLARELGDVHPVASILRTVRHLEGTATPASMVDLALSARRRAAVGDRPVRIDDVASVAFDDPRPMEERLAGALDVACRVVADLLDGHVPTFASAHGIVVPDLRSPESWPFGSRLNSQEFRHGALLRSMVGRAAWDLLTGRNADDRGPIEPQASGSATDEAHSLYAYADARRLVTMWTDEIGDLTAMLLEGSSLDRNEILDFASRTELGPGAPR